MIQLNASPTLGLMVGTSATSSLIAQINSEMGGGSFFSEIGDVLNKKRQMFIDNKIKPIREMARNIIKKKLKDFSVADKIVIIDDEKKLEAIPTCMHEPILAYAPIKELFNEGRIYGFGFEEAPEEDMYGRLINNGRIEDVGAAMNKKGEVTFKYEWTSLDPDLDIDELDCIEETRNWLDKFLSSSQIDPTDYPNLKG